MYSISLSKGNDRTVSVNLMFTFIRKNVILVRRSTVAFKSCNFSGDAEGKLFLNMERSILSELCKVSKSLINFSFPKFEAENLSQADTLVHVAVV